MPNKPKYDNSRQPTIPYYRPAEEEIISKEEKLLDSMDKLQTEISDIKQAVGCISTDLKKLTVSVHTLQIAVDRLLKDKH